MQWALTHQGGKEHDKQRCSPIAFAILLRLKHEINNELGSKLNPIYHSNKCPVVLVQHCLRTRNSEFLILYYFLTDQVKDSPELKIKNQVSFTLFKVTISQQNWSTRFLTLAVNKIVNFVIVKQFIFQFIHLNNVCPKIKIKELSSNSLLNEL